MLLNPFPAPTSLQFFLPFHGFGAGFIHLRMHELPRAFIPLGEESEHTVGVVVLLQPSFNVRGLPDVGFARTLGLEDVYNVVHDMPQRKSHAACTAWLDIVWHLGQDSNL